MNGKQFFEKLPKEFTYEERNKIEQAYWVAKAAHRLQIRDGGERYFNHPRRVALSVAKYIPLLKYGDPKVAANHIIAALLHDVVEDCYLPQGMICDLFGEEVKDWVFGLSKNIPRYDNTSGYVVGKRKIGAEKYLKKMAKDGWLIECIIKMCDRLDNLRTMGKGWPKKRQLKYINETKTMLSIFRRFYETAIYIDLQKEAEKAIKRLSVK